MSEVFVAGLSALNIFMAALNIVSGTVTWVTALSVAAGVFCGLCSIFIAIENHN